MDRADARTSDLALYLVIVVVGTALAAFGGGLAAMLLVTPFVVALPLGMRRRDDAVIDVRVTLDSQRCLEGDTVQGRIDITGPPGATIEVVIECPTTALTAPLDNPWAWHIAADMATPVGLPLTIETNRWGRFSLGELLVRVIDHGSLLDRRAHVIDLPDLMVLPIAPQPRSAAPARRCLTPHSGPTPPAGAPVMATTSPRSGYQPGDRVRDLNWRATLRRGEPHVNRRHPERAGDVVIVLDAFPDSLRGQTEVGEDLILRAGRAAWAIAREHLAANDRVGFVAEGANPVWLPPAPGGGRGTVAAGAARRVQHVDRGPARDPADTALPDPPAALVIGISPLGRERTLRMMIGLRGAGRSVAVMAIDTIDWLTSDWFTEHGTQLPEGARRLAQLTFEERIGRCGVRACRSSSGDPATTSGVRCGCSGVCARDHGARRDLGGADTDRRARARWSTATVVASVVAAMIPVAAGGPGVWSHGATAIVTVAGFALAALHRWTLEVPVIVAVLSVMTVADRATIDRAVVAVPNVIAVSLRPSVPSSLPAHSAAPCRRRSGPGRGRNVVGVRRRLRDRRRVRRA